MAETPTEVAVARFDGEGTAVRSYAEAKERSRKEAPWMAKVGFVEHHHNGRLVLRGAFAGHYLDVDESDSVSQSGAAEGAVGGGLVGVLLGPPGMAVGLVLGSLSAHTAATPPKWRPSPTCWLAVCVKRYHAPRRRSSWSRARPTWMRWWPPWRVTRTACSGERSRRTRRRSSRPR